MDIKNFLLWLPMILIAFGNAMIRELLFAKRFSDLTAHQLSTITLIIFCGIYVWLVSPLLNVQTSEQAFLIGLVWLLLTVAFEFSLGRLTNKSWAYLLQDYNIFAGRIWLIFLICLFLMPYVFYTMRHR